MIENVCLDSDILIDILNDRFDLNKINGTLHTTSINTYEVWFGRKNNEDILKLLQMLNILEFDGRDAILAAEIMKKLRSDGREINERDVFIGAVCINKNVELSTNNKKDFERLKEFGLKLI